MIPESPAVRRYRTQFDELEKCRSDAHTLLLPEQRREAIEAFEAEGFPTTKHEEWRFTNVTPLTKIDFKVCGSEAVSLKPEELAPYLLPDALHLVFLDGRYSPEYSTHASLPDGVIVDHLSNRKDEARPWIGTGVPSKENAFTALNTALADEGLYVMVPRGVVVDRPVQAVYVVTEQTEIPLYAIRNIVRLEAHAQLTLVETYVGIGESVSFSNVTTELFVGNEAHLEHVKLQSERQSSYHIAHTTVKQAAASSYTAATAALGGALTRETLTVLLEEEGAECSLSGVSLASGSQHVDHHTVIDHQKPNCNSHEIYKYVLDGSSHGVFNGKVFVRQDAQKTDARQTNNCLLLSDTATIDTKPQLEIFADDVKCSHGATVGQLDDEQVFYMRARGIPLARAREILTMAFVGAVVATIHHDAVRQFVEAAVRTRLNRMRGQGETKR